MPSIHFAEGVEPLLPFSMNLKGQYVYKPFLDGCEGLFDD